MVGGKVTLRYDPSAPVGRPIQVWHDGKQIELAKPVDLYANCFVKRNRPADILEADGPAPQPAASGLSLRGLVDDEEGK